jgi:hypothetical protein
MSSMPYCHALYYFIAGGNDIRTVFGSIFTSKHCVPYLKFPDNVGCWIFEGFFGYFSCFNPFTICVIPDDCLILGTIDSYGHLIVSHLDIVVDGNFTIL